MGEDQVKKRFADIINSLVETKELTALEYGCGYQSLHSFLDQKIKYIATEIDQKALQQNALHDSTGYFVQMENTRLPIRTSALDVIASIFVFHFNITDEQVSELFRALKSEGVLIFNLYLLPKDKREQLFTRLETHGFYCHRSTDQTHLRNGHEYCFLAKDVNSPLLRKAIKRFELDNIGQLKFGGRNSFLENSDGAKNIEMVPDTLFVPKIFT